MVEETDISPLTTYVAIREAEQIDRRVTATNCLSRHHLTPGRNCHPRDHLFDRRGDLTLVDVSGGRLRADVDGGDPLGYIERAEQTGTWATGENRSGRHRAAATRASSLPDMEAKSLARWCSRLITLDSPCLREAAPTTVTRRLQSVPGPFACATGRKAWEAGRGPVFAEQHANSALLVLRWFHASFEKREKRARASLEEVMVASETGVLGTER
ncbi:hypothetical protein V8E54_008900 [Elaphomyces granulatus]